MVKVIMQEVNDAEKGRRFQATVREFVEDIVGENAEVKVFPNKQDKQVQGLSTSWKVDIVVMGKSLLTNEFSIYLAIISCKNVKQGAKNRSTYWTEMSRAYMELNDLQLNSELGGAKFFLIVNRYCAKGETDKGYPLLFKNIGVEMINFNDKAERQMFATHLCQQLSKVSPIQQTKSLEEIFKEHLHDKTA